MLKHLVFLLAALPALATTTVQQIATSNTQAVIFTKTDQAGNCAWRISETPLSPTYTPINDVNTTLFPGSNSDARSGSGIEPDGKTHYFVAGTRKGDLGSDGNWYSRALAADTLHYYGVTCGTDAEVTGTFTTGQIPLGGVHIDPIPFDSRALGNYAVPTFNFANLAQMYVDPQTGFKFRLMTGPGQYPVHNDVVTGSAGTTYNPGTTTAEILTSTNWANPSNCLVVDGSDCTYTAAAQDVLTIRLYSYCGYPGYCPYNNSWEDVGNGLGTSVDSYQLSITCDGSGSTIQADVAYSWNGVSQGSEWEPQTCPSASGAVVYPSSLNGAGTTSWQSVNHPLIPDAVMDTTERKMTVNTSGTAVTQTAGQVFSLDPRVLTAGSKIAIAGSEYTIASVNSATSLTLTTSAGSQTGVAAYIDNFSVMVRKHTASAGTLDVDGVTVRFAWSSSFFNGRSGFQIYCSALTSTDSNGYVGRLCSPPDNIFAGGALYWVTNDLQVRFISAGQLVATTDYAGLVENYSAPSMWDASDPNSWYVATTVNATGHVILLKATYNPAGAGGGCMQTANYQALPLDPNYAISNMINCNITYTEVTSTSPSSDIWSQLPAAITGRKFPQPQLAGVQNGKAILTTYNGQDTEGWYVLVDVSTGNVSGVYSTYMNTLTPTSGHAPCRACVLHGTQVADSAAPYFGFVTNNYFGGTETGAGPYEFNVTTSLTTTPGTSVSVCQAAVTDTTVNYLIQYTLGCDTITLGGSDNIPCDPNPSTWESANMPACTWQTGWTQWQAGAIKPGDWFQDPDTGGELMVFLKNTSGTTWIVGRNVNIPQAALAVQDPTVTSAYLKAHTATWTGALICNYQGTPVESTTDSNGTGILLDAFTVGGGHETLVAAGITSAARFFTPTYVTANAIRMGTLPGAVNQPATSRINNSATFAGASGLSGTFWVQSHPGFNGNPNFFTDMAPIAGSGGGNFSLWSQPGVVNVTGSLYKIPAADATVGTPNKRFLTEGVWSGMYNFEDVSGTGSIGGTSADWFHYCSIDYTGATCGQSGAGEALGDLFVNIPMATVDGNSGGMFDFNRVNAAPLGQQPMAALQYFFTNLGPNALLNDGSFVRRLTTSFDKYGGQDTYSNAKMIPNSNILMFNCTAENLQRMQDDCLGALPQNPPTIAQDQSNFETVNIHASGGSAYAEVQFGYAEFGAPSSFFCTTRQEACNTSSPGGTPFNWEGETRTLLACSTGCTVQVPKLWGHVMYYRIRRSANGTTWTNGPLMVWADPK